MKNLISIFFVTTSITIFMSCSSSRSDYKSISYDTLKDKIAGGWAGKMIGVTYGAPTEFKASGRTYEDSIRWKPSDVKGSLWQDDLYVQLAFLITMDKYGIDAPAKRFHESFAKAGFPLWHANVQARKNYFDSIFPPQSGQPEFNLHADDIDFQIEADYIGFMCPAMPITASRIADKIGHIMNYGDGVYGGVFVGALYSAAFFENDITKIINEALLSIPAESDYSKIIKDVIRLHSHYPDNWRSSWSELQSKWGKDHICGAGSDFDIDAKLNGAYIVMGLLYGEGDPLKTMEITTRCGQDSDCNPSNAMAVLGVIKGFNGLPATFREAVNAIGDSIFINTNYSFKKAVDKTFEYARKLTTINGGKENDRGLLIISQQPVPLKMENSFPKVVFDKRIRAFSDESCKMTGNWQNYRNRQAVFSGTKGDEINFTFEGTGISIVGNWLKDGGKADIYVDGKFQRTIDCYFYFSKQEHQNMDLAHFLNLPQGIHTLRLIVKGEKRPESLGTNVYVSEAVIFKSGNKSSENYRFSFQK